MTPDELRRMDNDLCIIYEKGLKPIKANKYYYFKYPEGKTIAKYKLDHNDVHIDRGIWRKFNPNNPYEEGQDSGGNAPSLESLDELFGDEELNTPLPNDAVLNPDPIQTEESKKAREEEAKRQEELLDIQKELEAKFDELFGTID